MLPSVLPDPANALFPPEPLGFDRASKSSARPSTAPLALAPSRTLCKRSLFFSFFLLTDVGALKPAVKTLKVGSFIRPHLRIGALVVTVNAVLSRNDGYALLRQEHGPDAEKVGGSTAYVWRVTEVTCDDADGGVSKKKI